jgi:lipopolysaccharide cholinephosphotransferase
MKELTLKEIQQVMLEELTFIDKFCRENGIKYTLSSGTCLGAVRHKGFIPWDDDADMYMDRKNYNKFIDLMQKQSGKYKVIRYDLSNTFNMPFTKVVDTTTVCKENRSRVDAEELGVWVDIFPIDNAPNDEKSRKKLQRKILILHRELFVACNTSKNPIKKMIKWVARPFIDAKKVCRRIDKLAQKYDNVECKYMWDIVWGDKFWEKHCWENLIETDFEGHKFFIPKDYDTFLTRCYGDYMTPPPENERPAHDMVSYKKDQGSGENVEA